MGLRRGQEISEEEARDIKRTTVLARIRGRVMGTTYRNLARKHNVSLSSVKNIARGYQQKDVSVYTDKQRMCILARRLWKRLIRGADTWDLDDVCELAKSELPGVNDTSYVRMLLALLTSTGAIKRDGDAVIVAKR